MRRSASLNAACSAAGAHTVTANPDRLARSATASATGLEPQITTWGRGSTGSTKMSMVPWLGHMFLAKRTPPCSSPALWPWPSSTSSGATDTSRDLPSASASFAALSTAARAQPPPIQPCEMVPSGRITALAPALAAVAATVRTTVASTKDSPDVLRDAMVSRMSSARFISNLRQIRLERCEALEIVRQREQIDIGQRRLHAARLRRVIAPADQRIEPDDLFASPPQPAHLFGELARLAGVVAVGDDHQRGARIDDAPGVPAIEGGEALADSRTAADALRHQRQLLDRACHVAIAQRRRDVSEAGVEHERFGFAERIDHTVQEANEERGVEAHRAGGIEQHDEAQRFDLAPAPSEFERHSAVRHIAMNGAAQIEPPAAAADLVAPHEARPHDASEPRCERMGRRNLFGIDDMAQVGCRQIFDARGALAAAPALRLRFTVAVTAPFDAIRQTERLLRHMGFGEFFCGRRVAGARHAGKHLPP